MSRHAYMYLIVFGLAYSWVSFVHAFRGEFAIADLPRRRHLLSDLGPGGTEDGSWQYRYRQREQNKCPPLHGLDAYGDCPYCSNNCDECSANYKVCTECIKGYQLVKGDCRPCNSTLLTRYSDYCYGSCKTSNCSACFADKSLALNGTCVSCTSGFFNGTSCLKCPEYCTKCKMDTTGKFTCTECQGDDIPDLFFDLVKGKCVNQCPELCAGCRRNDSGKVLCPDCQEGSGRDKHNVCRKCADPNCNYCNWKGGKMKCRNCDGGYHLLNNGSCYQCPENCLDCDLNSTTNEYVCTDCYGWDTQILLPNRTCQFCPSGCEVCAWENDKVVCKQCERLLNSDPYGIFDGECVQCPSEGCTQCREVENGVLSCEKVMQIVNLSPFFWLVTHSSHDPSSYPDGVLLFYFILFFIFLF
jgi:hypothetical protein